MSDEVVGLVYPCRFPIKAMGRNQDGFAEHVVDLIAAHAPDLDRDAVQSTPSRNARFVSITVVIHAISEVQVEAIRRDLVADARVLAAL